MQDIFGGDDMGYSDVYAEAKAVGYDPKIMRKVVSLRKMDTHDRREQDRRRSADHRRRQDVAKRARQ